MPSTSGNRPTVREATVADLARVKRLADAHRHELGFVLLPSLREQIERQEMLVAIKGEEVIGFVDYHRRRDGQITLYHIAVEAGARRQGVGRALLDALQAEARRTDSARIALKCPADLPANHFYGRYGFKLQETLAGRKRPLNVWTLSFEPPPHN